MAWGNFLGSKVFVSRVHRRALLVSCDLPNNKGPRHGHWRGFPRVMRYIMRTAKNAKIQLPPTTNEYKPDDLEAMRQAFICACSDNPDLSATETQRYDLADAMVRVYQKHFSQQ